jgi:DNA-binding transcriptional LysR family regulator
MPVFLRRYPEISVDLHLSDATVDLIGDGFDAALRIAVLTNFSLVARRLCPIVPRIVAAPSYLARYGRPQHPGDLAAHHCLGNAYRARGDVWRFTGPRGKEVVVAPSGPLRVTNVDALIPTVLDGLGIAELPDSVANPYLSDGRIEAILPGWHIAPGIFIS